MTEEEVFQIFGRISVVYSTLDFIITVLIMEIVNDNYKSPKNALNDNMTLGKKLDIIKNLEDSDVKSAVALQSVNKFIDDAILISKERNRFMHDQWLFAPNDLAEGKISKLTLVNLRSWGIDNIKSDFYSAEDLNNQHYKLLQMVEKVHITINELRALNK